MQPAHFWFVAKPQLNSPDPEVASSAQSETGRSEAKLSEFEREVIAIFVEMMQTLGLPKSFGEIYGLLYATPQALGFGEIHEKLNLSKGSVSGGLKALREIGAVKTIISPEDRRERYEPETELRKLVIAYLQERIQPQLDSNAERMAGLESLLPQTRTSATQKKALESRLAKLAKWRHKAAGIVPWVARFLG